MKLAIVIVAFNRDASLKRLLTSINDLKVDKSIQPQLELSLIISIDKSDNPLVAQIADSFDFKLGPKYIFKQEVNLGLKEHVLQCGDRSQDYDGIMVLEDDIVVSKYAVNYAFHALRFYENDSRIAGIALYSTRYNETAMTRFEPLRLSHHSNFFMQIPCSWGQVWSNSQWRRFKEWYYVFQNSKKDYTKEPRIPFNVLKWPAHSWKKIFYTYQIEHNLYFVYPYISYSTNFADQGVNHKDSRSSLQRPLAQFQERYQFLTLDDDQSVIYDPYSEIMPQVLKKFSKADLPDDLVIDLYGTKPEAILQKYQYCLTAKNSLSRECSFSRKLYPHEMNIIENVQEESELSLSKPEYLIEHSLYSSQDLKYFYQIRQVQLNMVDQTAKLRQPTFSIVTVCFNCKDDISTTINSVQNQTFKDYEHLIIDGGSTDGTIEVVESYATLDPRIKFWTAPDNGIYHAMNKGIYRATGKYLNFLNSGDSYLTKDALQSVFDTYKSSSTRTPLLFTEAKFFSRSDEFLFDVKPKGVFTIEDIRKNGTGTVNHQCVFIEKDKCPYYDSRFDLKGELNWYYEIAEKVTTQFLYLNKPIIRYVVGGRGNTQYRRNLREWIYLTFLKFGPIGVLRTIPAYRRYLAYNRKIRPHVFPEARAN